MEFKRTFFKGSYTKETHKIEVDISLREGRLSICASIREKRADGRWPSDVDQCGQCLDSVLELLPHNKTIQEIHEVWKRWHLNDMRAGSPAQEKYLRENPVKFEYPQSHYDAACKALESVGLNPDNGYRYGSAWLTEELPQEVIEKVKSWQVPT